MNKKVIQLLSLIILLLNANKAYSLSISHSVDAYVTGIEFYDTLPTFFDNHPNAYYPVQVGNKVSISYTWEEWLDNPYQNEKLIYSVAIYDPTETAIALESSTTFYEDTNNIDHYWDNPAPNSEPLYNPPPDIDGYGSFEPITIAPHMQEDGFNDAYVNGVTHDFAIRDYTTIFGLIGPNDYEIYNPDTNEYYWGSIDISYSTPAPVPEPATMLLLCTGIAGLAGTRIRKKFKK